ncbi:hypothetical protein SV7mr_49040 [Stieleria bergensis]|uniref:Uncharacterized protein n=1 Tax=Stieleria bergensis TaxID=2528025 RepID=A0A517T1V7_9BACT|nr:hypothetical protein SV7mr_49040 [Planctomycetes bacterium SV_7m_r]
MPGLLDVDNRCDHAIKNNSTDFVFRDRFNCDSHAAGGTFCSRLADFDCCIAYESSKFNGPFEWIGERSQKTAHTADRYRFGCCVVNANCRRVLHVGSWTASAWQSVLMKRIGSGEQSVVLGGRDIELVAGSDSSCHQSIPSALKLPSG